MSVYPMLRYAHDTVYITVEIEMSMVDELIQSLEMVKQNNPGVEYRSVFNASYSFRNESLLVTDATNKEIRGITEDELFAFQNIEAQYVGILNAYHGMGAFSVEHIDIAIFGLRLFKRIARHNFNGF